MEGRRFWFEQASMGRRRWLILAILSLILSCASGREIRISHKDHLPAYNGTLAKILVEYNSAVSSHGSFSRNWNVCPHKVYTADLTELFTWTCAKCNGVTKGFEVIEVIVDIPHCLQAYVGVAKNLNAILIAFRGTQEHSIQNWIEDLFWKQLDLNYIGMSGAMVHHGFYSAYHNTTVRPAVLGAVESAKEMYGDLDIIVIGHSMGGAMASFCGLDLVVNIGAKNVQVMTFGQPRVGNAAFASYYARLVPNTFRVTHDHDIVPHLPPYYYYFPQKTYHHFPREVWLHDIGEKGLNYGDEIVCDGSGEDPDCSRSVMGRSVADHLVYYGVNLKCEEWRTCNIVMDHRLEQYKRSTDPYGSIVLSKAPHAVVLKMKTESDNAKEILESR